MWNFTQEILALNSKCELCLPVSFISLCVALILFRSNTTADSLKRKKKKTKNTSLFRAFFPFAFSRLSRDMAPLTSYRTLSAPKGSDTPEETSGRSPDLFLTGIDPPHKQRQGTGVN